MAANDFLQGFRTGSDAYNQARALKDRRDATKQQGDFEKLRIKLEEERNALAKENLDNTRKFQGETLAETIRSNQAREGTNAGYLDLQKTGQEFNNAVRQQELGARLKETGLRERLMETQITAAEQEQAIRGKLGLIGEKIFDRHDAYNQALDQRTYYSQRMADMVAAGATDTPEFNEAQRMFTKFDSLALAAREGLKADTAIVGATLAQKGDASAFQFLTRALDSDTKAKSSQVSMRYEMRPDPITGELVPVTSLSGNPEEVQSYLERGFGPKPSAASSGAPDFFGDTPTGKMNFGGAGGEEPKLNPSPAEQMQQDLRKPVSALDFQSTPGANAVMSATTDRGPYKTKTLHPNELKSKSSIQTPTLFFETPFK